jgi:hypothetical protein
MFLSPLLRDFQPSLFFRRRLSALNITLITCVLIARKWARLYLLSDVTDR